MDRYHAKAQSATDGYKDVFGEDISDGELVWLLCVAQHETRCGDSWPGAYNWGAVQAGPPTVAERQRIDAGELKAGDVVPGRGILHQDTNPATGKYWVWFQAFPSDRQGAAQLVVVLYKHNPEARAAARADTNPADAMYRRGYYEGFHPGARGVYGPGGKLLRVDPLNDAEAANVADYAGALERLYPGWCAAIDSPAVVARVQPDPGQPTPPGDLPEVDS